MGNLVTAAIGLRQSQSSDYMQKPFSVAVLLARISCVSLSLCLPHSVSVCVCLYLEDTQIEHILVIANWNRNVGGGGIHYEGHAQSGPLHRYIDAATDISISI